MDKEYTRGTTNYKNHMKKKAPKWVAEYGVVTWAGTLNILGRVHWIFGTTKHVKEKPVISLILLDEAAQATEPSVLQVLNLSLIHI